MGLVFRAHHTELGVDLAVKVLGTGAERDRAAFDRFRREARAAAALRSPHVVDVRDYGLDHGLPYIVMELLEGESLGERLERAPGLSLGELGRYAAQAAVGLECAHRLDLVHRDVKPSNLFLATVGETTTLKVLDFGIVKSLNEGDSAGSTMVGSPGYLSPEQARGERVDHRTDLWSLAAVLYRACTGCEPFAAPSLVEVIERVCVRPIAPPSALVPALPAELDEFFAKGLCRDPAGRFQSAEEFAAAFGAVAERHAACFLPATPSSDGRGPSPRLDSTRSWASWSNLEPAKPRAGRRRARRAAWVGLSLCGALLVGGVGLSHLGSLGQEGFSSSAEGRRTPVAAPPFAVVAPRPLGPPAEAAAQSAAPTGDPPFPPVGRATDAPAAQAVGKPAMVARKARPANAPHEESRGDRSRQEQLDPTFGLPVTGIGRADATPDGADHRRVAPP
jgi:serine/threonine-protein kinase